MEDDQSRFFRIYMTASHPKLLEVTKVQFIRLYNLKVLEKTFASVVAGFRFRHCH